MPHWTHLVFEFGIFALFVICFIQAWNAGRRHWFMLLGAVAFGLIAEAIGASPRTVGEPFHQPERLTEFWLSAEGTSPKQFGYYYGDFVFTVFGDAIPVCIGVGWAIILYTAYRTVLRLDALPALARPFLAASLALTLDLIMDPVASNLVKGPGDGEMNLPQGLGMWFWFDNEGSKHYHVFDKVPLPNFMGWFLVVFLTVFLSRTIWVWLIKRGWLDKTSKPQTGPWWKDALAMLFIVVLALIFTWAGVNGFHWLYRRYEVVAAFVVSSALLIPGPLMFMYYVPVLRRDWPPDKASLSVAGFFLIFFIFCWWSFDYYQTIRYSVYAFPTIFFIALVLYVWPYRLALFGHPRPEAIEDPLGV